MGGFTAIHAAARDPAICAVVAICPAPEDLLVRALRADGPERFRCDVEATEAWLASLDLYEAVAGLGPDTGLLLLHARGDEQVPYTVSEQLFAAAHEPKRLLLLPGGHHRSLQHDHGAAGGVAPVRARHGRGLRARTENDSRLGSSAVPSPVDLVELPFLREALDRGGAARAGRRARGRLGRAPAARLLLARGRLGHLPGPRDRRRHRHQRHAAGAGGGARVRRRRGRHALGRRALGGRHRAAAGGRARRSA